MLSRISLCIEGFTVRFFIYLFVCLYSTVSYASDFQPISGCNEVKVQGFCKPEVKIAKETCKDKDQGEDIAKSFANIKATKLSTSTNLKKLSQKYDDLNKSSKTEAQNKKACVQVAKAAKKDCNSKCEAASGGGRSTRKSNEEACEKSLESIEQVIDYCKKNQEAAEEMAALAEENAKMYGSTPPDGGTTSTGATPILKPSTVDTVLGYAQPGTGGSATSDASGADTTQAVTDMLKTGGSSGGGGSGGADAGTQGLGDGENSEMGSVGYTTEEGMGLTGSGSGSGGNSKNSDSSGTTITGGKSDGAPGYMLWGVPARKKKAPLTLLPPPALTQAVAPKTDTPTKAPASVEDKTVVPGIE